MACAEKLAQTSTGERKAVLNELAEMVREWDETQLEAAFFDALTFAEKGK